MEDFLRQLQRTLLIIVDEVGYIPFDAEAANLFFQLVSSRYERAAMLVTSNKPFAAWGEIFGLPVVAAATAWRNRRELRAGMVAGRGPASPACGRSSSSTRPSDPAHAG